MADLTAIPIPINVVFYGLLSAMFGLWLAMKALFRERIPVRIRALGVSKVGKTTLLRQLQTPGPVSDVPESTKEMSHTFNIGYQFDPEDEKTKRTINIRDPTGFGHLNGDWWKILSEDQPKGIIYIVDQRSVGQMAPGAHIAAEHDQLHAFKSLVSMLTHQQYKSKVAEANRVRLFVLAVNKMDDWYQGVTDIELERSTDEISEPYKDHLRYLKSQGIAIDILPIRTNHKKYTRSMMDMMLRFLDDYRRPIYDYYMFRRLGLADQVRYAEKLMRRIKATFI